MSDLAQVDQAAKHQMNFLFINSLLWLVRGIIYSH